MADHDDVRDVAAGEVGDLGDLRDYFARLTLAEADAADVNLAVSRI